MGDTDADSENQILKEEQDAQVTKLAYSLLNLFVFGGDVDGHFFNLFFLTEKVFEHMYLMDDDLQMIMKRPFFGGDVHGYFFNLFFLTEKVFEHMYLMDDDLQKIMKRPFFVFVFSALPRKTNRFLFVN